MATVGMVLWGRYRLLDVLGDGGMARVFRAEDQRLNRIVAIKILHQQYLGQAEFVRRFEQEAQLAAGLSHPNIVAIYDIGREDETYFIVMEYVEGRSLKEVIAREAPLPLDRVITIMRQIGLALDVAHAHGVIHRDIKPENILLTPANHVKVSDFGIARALTSPGQTATGIVLGSVSYFSPEQAQGKPATAESDLYSSGIVLYEMLTQRLPFAADNPLATAMQHITQQPVPPRTFVPSLPPAIDNVVLKALHKNPASRFHSGAELADALTVAAMSPAGQAPLPVARTLGRASNAQAPTIRTLRASPSPMAPPRRRAPVVPLLLALLLGGAVYAAYQHRTDIGGLFAGAAGAPATATATETSMPGTGTPRASATTPAAALVPATATTTSVPLSPSPTTGVATPSPTGRATPSPTVTSRPPTATATPSAHPSPTPKAPSPTPTHSPSAGGAGQISADIVTAAGYAYNASDVPQAVHPQDTFSLSAGKAIAVIQIHHYPKGAKVGARWTFPNGKSYDVIIPDRYSTYWVEEYFGMAGPYNVSALVGGKVVGAHHFMVMGTSATSGTGPSGAAPTVAPGTVPQTTLAMNANNADHKSHQHGRDKAHKDRQNGGGDAGDGVTIS